MNSDEEERAGEGAPVLASTGEAGIYVHVPFCRRRCPYCDFAITVRATVPSEQFLDQVLRELRARGPELGADTVRSVYFGGGTPSLWGAPGIAATLEAVRQDPRLKVALREVTVEVNPEDMSLEFAQALLRAGVTRLSFGVQSFDDTTLRRLGREHRGEQAEQTLRLAADAGFEELSLDLIYAVPDEPAERLHKDLRVLERLGDAITHVSAYELTIEDKTSFARLRERGELTPWSEEASVAASDTLRSALKELGYSRYEISSYARPGHEAVHNSGYWSGDGYLGLGPSAHSLRIHEGRVERRANARSWRHWAEGAPPEREVISPRMHIAELVFVGARRSEGVDFAALEQRFGAARVAPFVARARAWVDRGWGTWLEGRFVPSTTGLALCDLIAEEAVALAGGV